MNTWPTGEPVGVIDRTNPYPVLHQVFVDYDLLDVPADAALDAVVRVAAAVAGTPIATVNLLDTLRYRTIARFAWAGRTVAREESLCHITTRTTRPTVIADLSRHPEFADNPFVDGRYAALRFYVGVPLVVQDVVVGTLCVFDLAPGEVTADQLARLVDLAAVVVRLLEDRREVRAGAGLAEAAARTRSLLTVAHDDVVQARAFERTLLEVLPVGVMAAGPAGEVLLTNQLCREWLGDVLGARGPQDISGRHPLLDIDALTPLTSEDIPLVRVLKRVSSDESRELVLASEGKPHRAVHVRAVPVYDPDGIFLGAVTTLQDITAQRDLAGQLRDAALHDALTGLPNRSLLVDRLDHALATVARVHDQVGVLFCDLDGFKAVNDEFGHGAGDDVLRTAAARMRSAVRPGDTVGRIGGDEFVVICPQVGSLDSMLGIAARIEAALATPMDCSDGLEHRVGISIGAVLSGPGSTPETLLADADAEMYRVKRARKGR